MSADLFDAIRIPKRRGRPPLTPEQRAERHQPAKRFSRGKQGGDKTEARFLLQPLNGRGAHLPAYDAAFITEARTKYPSTVVGPDQRVLKSGTSQAKIGGRVLTGKWNRMPVYCLTLEERATCPGECPMWRGCYGNNMHLARRFEHGPELEAALREEVAVLSRQHPLGFVVRLHILGDFYSVEYVQLWAELLDRHDALRIYGYTARWRWSDPIARELLRLAYAQWDRFAMRFSNAPVETASTITIEHLGQKPADAVVCPVQLGKSESCSTCALCWQTDKRIAFIRH